MRAVAVPFLVLALAACGGDPAAPDAGAQDSGPADADPDAPDAGPADAAEQVACGTETADVYHPGMIRTGEGGATIELVSSVPAPPARFDNAWIVRSPDGPITAVTPWMPAHGHGAQKEVVITATGEPDEYSLDPVNLWMPGMWEVRIDVDMGGVSDRVVFRFCISS